MECIKKEIPDCRYREMGGCVPGYCQHTVDLILEALLIPKAEEMPAEPTPAEPEPIELPEPAEESKPVEPEPVPKKRGRKKNAK